MNTSTQQKRTGGHTKPPARLFRFLKLHAQFLFHDLRGDEVKQGDVIGRVGTTGNSTGNHLHLGLYVKGDYLDPAKYVNFKNDPDKMKNLFD